METMRTFSTPRNPEKIIVDPQVKQYARPFTRRNMSGLIRFLGHPELAVILAKLGCDLVVSSGETLSWEDLLLSRMRTVNGVAVATCGRNAGEITCMQGLHGGRDHEFQDQPGICSYQLDTAGTRKKYFDYCIDYDLLLKTTASTR